MLAPAQSSTTVTTAPNSSEIGPERIEIRCMLIMPRV